MVKDIIYITKETTYKQLRAILLETPQLKSYPFVTDRRLFSFFFTKIKALDSMTLLGSISRKYLTHLLSKKLGPDPAFPNKRVFTPSEILNTLRKWVLEGCLEFVLEMKGVLEIWTRKDSNNRMNAKRELF